MKNNVVIGFIAIVLGLFGIAAGIILYTDYYMNQQISAQPSASAEVWTDDGTGASEEMIPVEPSDALTGASENPPTEAGTGASQTTSPDAVSGATQDSAPADAVSGASETSEDGYESDDRDEYESDEYEDREYEENDDDEDDDD